MYKSNLDLILEDEVLTEVLIAMIQPRVNKMLNMSSDVKETETLIKLKERMQDVLVRLEIKSEIEKGVMDMLFLENILHIEDSINNIINGLAEYSSREIRYKQTLSKIIKDAEQYLKEFEEDWLMDDEEDYRDTLDGLMAEAIAENSYREHIFKEVMKLIKGDMYE